MYVPCSSIPGIPTATITITLDHMNDIITVHNLHTQRRQRVLKLHILVQ